MYCPVEHWQRAYADGWRRVGRLLRRKLPEWLESLAGLASLGPVVMAPGAPPEPAQEAPGKTGAKTDGPPPGHPARLPVGQPPSPAERELWAGLEGLEW